MAIQIIGNVGNQGFALPMVSAFPTDVNVQQLLAWDTVAQALAYVPYTGNSSGDFGVTRDLTVGRHLTVAQNSTFTGTILGSIVVANSIAAGTNVIATGFMQAASADFAGNCEALTHTAIDGANDAQLASTGLLVEGLALVGTRKIGWGAPTGTATRTTFATGSVTLPQLAERVKALIDDLTTHGLIGA